MAERYDCRMLLDSTRRWSGLRSRQTSALPSRLVSSGPSRFDSRPARHALRTYQYAVLGQIILTLSDRQQALMRGPGVQVQRPGPQYAKCASGIRSSVLDWTQGCPAFLKAATMCRIAREAGVEIPFSERAGRRTRTAAREREEPLRLRERSSFPSPLRLSSSVSESVRARRARE
ncbi:hypothetical protein FKP32DRAFT_44715 [Trametes sanguinea]|nr:hypothetical protein FKP32DRAFT_44715 [Trametes sanguinea]